MFVHNDFMGCDTSNLSDNFINLIIPEKLARLVLAIT